MESTIHVFLSYLRVEKGLAQNTILAYGRDLKRFAAFLRKRHKQRMEEVNREDVVDFLSSLYKEKLDSRSVARYLVSLRGFYKFAMMEEHGRHGPDGKSGVAENPAAACRRICASKKSTSCWQAPNLATPIGLRDRAMLEVLYSTGLRVSELLNLRISDIDMRIGCVRCIGKGDKERLVPIGRKAIEAVEQYLAQARPKFARPSSPPPHNQSAVSDEDRQEAQPRQHLEDPARLWSAGWACAGASRRISCVTVLPRTCWKGVRTSARSSSCWATRIFPRLRFTRTWSRSA